jgi:hypothetical protein
MDFDPRRSLSITQFCWAEGISKAKYYDLQKKGLAPAVTDIDGVQRITPEARAEWHQRMAERAKGEAARLEAERRRELAVIAGRAAAASPNHVSKNPVPQDVVSEFATLLKSYSVVSVTGDRYAGEWPREQFQKAGISYEAAAEPKSNLYRDLLPLVNSRKIDLLDHPRLINQLCGLERRTARGGRDSIDHALGGHDDCCNAVAGLASLSGSKYRYPAPGPHDLDWVSSSKPADIAKQSLNFRMAQHVRMYAGGRRW